MKKIMISLLMIAATLNAMAVTYTGKAKVTLKSSDNRTCAAVIATSADFNDGLNSEYYASLNEEGYDVLLYVEYEGNKYAHFGSSAATMQNMPLVMKANAATSYSLSFSSMVGTISIYDTKEANFVDMSSTYNFTIEAGQANSVIADRFVINYVAPTPAEPSLCFSNDVLDVIGYAGKTLKVEKEDGTPVVAEHALASDAEHFNLAQPSRTRLVVTLDGKAYQIDASVVPDPVVP